jgi:PAS domain S-box-containing protein
MPTQADNKPLLVRGLTGRFILYILAFGCAFALTLTAVRLLQFYRHQHRTAVAVLDRIEGRLLDGIAESLWRSDTGSLHAKLESILRLPEVTFIEVIQKERPIITLGRSAMDPVVSRSYPLGYRYGNRLVPLGTLTVDCELQDLSRRLFKQAAFILLAESTRVFIVAAFVFSLFYWLVVRHLRSLADYTQTLSLSTLEAPFRLNRSTGRRQQDDLDLVVNSINDMRINLNHSYQELRTTNLLLQEEVAVRRRIEDALRKSEERLSLITDSVPALIAYVDRSLQFRFINAYAKPFFGLSPSKVLGFSAAEVLGDRVFDRLKSRFADALAGEPQSFEIALDRPENQAMQVLADFIPHTVDREVVGIFVMATDISQRKQDEAEKKRLQEQLRQSHKMESIGTLAGGIAHDFNNLLGIILGNVDLASDDITDDVPSHHNLEEIRTAGLRAKEVVRQLLRFSRKADERQQPLNLPRTVEDSLKLMRSTLPATIRIRKNLARQCSRVMANATQIHQVIINLCTNAAHAMMENDGTLGVDVDEVYLSRGSLKLPPELPTGLYVRLTVTDSGVGIPQDMQDRIFDPYFTTKEIGKGTGMGLAVVHGIVKNHGGGIIIDSNPGKGSTFTILFPALTGDGS